MVAVIWIGLIGMISDVGIGDSGKRRSANVAWAAGSDGALLVQIMFYHSVFAPLRDPIIDQLETRTSHHVAAPR